MRAEAVVFGREPVAGRVKTRLARQIGAHSAAQVYRLLLEHTLAQTLASGLPVTLFLAEAATSDWRAPDGVALAIQGRGDLGGRMAAAFESRYAAGVDVVVLVGSDIPGLRTDHVLDAAERCRRAPVVLGPAWDGGYWLLALRSPGQPIFEDVEWSSPRTYPQTVERLRCLGVERSELALLRDLDTADDLRCSLEDPGVDHRLRTELAAVAGVSMPLPSGG